MDAIRNFLGKIGVISPASAVVPEKSETGTGKSGNPRPGSSAQTLEAKRKAAREYMQKKRAKEKADGIPEKELARRRKYNRERMRRLRA